MKHVSKEDMVPKASYGGVHVQFLRYDPEPPTCIEQGNIVTYNHRTPLSG
jgi:hypothetical protein